MALSLVSALVAVTCASGSEKLARPAAPPPTASAAPAALPSAEADPSSRAAEPTLASPPDDAAAAPADGSLVAGPVALSLPSFHAALAGLESKKRGRSVRILWLGDSHTAADFWTHAVRSGLQKRFGNGGPGYVMIGLAAYRHGGVKVTNEGAWRREPAAPAQSSRQLDGVFGLGGQRVKPAGADARAAVALLPGAVDGGAKFSVVYRATNADRLRLAIRGGESKLLDAAAGEAGSSGAGLRRASISGGTTSTLDVATAGGAPEIFGIYAESTRPGVVLDTLGINGARAATPLAWEAAPWQAEARARDPSLIVLAYGTNEVAGAWAVDRYEKSLEALATRVRAVGSELDCLVVGPPDMASADGKSAPRVVEHDEAARRAAARAGCAYFSAFAAMGGEGAFARWAKETPPLAAADRVHLRSAGYQRLGAALVEALLEGYRGAAAR